MKKRLISLLLIPLLLSGCFAKPGVDPTPTSEYDYVFDASNGIINPNETSKTIDGLSFSYKRLFKDQSNTNHIVLVKGGSLTLKTSLPKLSQIKVSYTTDMDNVAGIGDYMNDLVIKTSFYGIHNPHQGGKYIESDKPYSTNGNVFSLYSPHATTYINKIELKLDENTSHPQPLRKDDVDIYFINDLHGHASYMSDFESGLVSMVDDFKSYQAGNPEGTIFLSIGDQYLGTAISGMTNGHAVTDLMNEVGFDAQIVGNHEFDWGLERLEECLSYTAFDTLGINVMDVSTRKRMDFLGDKLLLNKNGHNIGIIGSGGNCYYSITENMREGFYYAKDTSYIKKASDELKANGAEFVILMTHGDSREESIYDTSLSKEGYVDLVLDAHTHHYYQEQDDFGVYHVQAGSYSQRFGKIHLDFSLGKVNVTCEDVPYYKFNSSYDERGQKILDYRNEELNNLPNEVLSNNAFELSRADVRDEVADELNSKLYDEANKILRNNNISDNVLCSIYFPDGRVAIPEGKVTYSLLYAALPFNNPLGVASILGRDLKEGNIAVNSYSISPSLTLDELVDEKTYYVITDSYTYTYSYNNMTHIDDFKYDELIKNDSFSNLRKEPYFDGSVYARDMLRLAYLNGKFDKN